MSEYVEWPFESADPVGLAVLLPGANYPVTMPLLTFAGRAVRQHGWRVRAVSWSAPDLEVEDTIEWVGTQLGETIGQFDGRVLVVGKSLGSCAAAYAAQHRLDAIWLTPLLHVPPVVDAVTRNAARQLLVGGTEDTAWDYQTARATGADVVQIDGADHGMFVDDAVRTAELHVDITRAIDEWLHVIA